MARNDRFPWEIGEYRYFVLNPRARCIESGWEYKEDAFDRVKEYREGVGLSMKVNSRRHLKKLGFHPADAFSWCRSNPK